MSSTEASQGTNVTMSFTLFEVPVFVKGGTMLPLAPPAGGDIGGVGGQGTSIQPMLGSAAREPELLTWEVYGVGATVKGSGTVWEDSRGATDASFSLEDGGETLELRITAPGDKRRHQFELINVPPATAVTTCTPSTEFDESLSSYDGATLTLNLHVTVHTGAAGGCLRVSFGSSLSSPAVQALLAVAYQQTRQRLHVIKQQFDDLCSTPGTYLMPLAQVTNTATRLTADCQIGAPNAYAAWAQEMSGFAAATNGALSSLLAWAKECPKSRFAAGDTTANCADFAQQTKAWVCGSAALGRMSVAICG